MQISGKEEFTLDRGAIRHKMIDKIFLSKFIFPSLKIDKNPKYRSHYRLRMCRCRDKLHSSQLPSHNSVKINPVGFCQYFNIMFFTNLNDMWWPYGMKVILTVNRDDMNNPSYGTKENPVPVLKDIGVDESLRDNDKDYDKAYMDSFYRKNVIRYLKYKMPKEEFKRRFLDKTN